MILDKTAKLEFERLETKLDSVNDQIKLIAQREADRATADLPSNPHALEARDRLLKEVDRIVEAQGELVGLA